MAGKIEALANGTLTETDGGRYGSAADPLLPNMINVDSACGCTLTRANITGLTPDTFEQLAMVETDLARIIANAAEAKILGVQERGLTTLLRSSIRDIKPALSTQKVDEQSIILPYIQRRQRSYMNSNYFDISAGQFAAAAVDDKASAWTGGTMQDTGKDTAGVVDDRYFNLTVTSLDFGEDIQGIKNTFKGGPTAIHRYFLPGSSVIVYSLDGTTAGTQAHSSNANGDQTTSVLVAEVVDSFDSTAGGKCYITCKAAYSATAKGAAADPVTSIQSGMLQIGANNVSDWEAWCNNQPADFNQRLIVNWLQTSRESRCVDQVYKDTLSKVLDGSVNPHAAGFRYLPLAEQNRIAAQHSDNAWLRSTFYGQAINEKQTVEGYTDLPQVHDPEANSSFSGYPTNTTGDDGCALEYKANAIGIFTQLVEASRVLDLKGDNLDLDTLFQLIYWLKRYRESDGDNIDVIDIMTDRYTADNLLVAFSRYYRAKYGAQLTRFVDQGKKLEFNNQVLFNYNVYDIPEIAVQIAVFHDPFFDDIISSAGLLTGTLATDGEAVAKADWQSSRRALYMLDWSDINVGIAGTNSVTRKHPNVDAQEMYRCRMEANVKEYQLKSTRWTTMLDRPQRHLIVQNFSDALPTTSALATGDVIDDAGALQALTNTGTL